MGQQEFVIIVHAHSVKIALVLRIAYQTAVEHQDGIPFVGVAHGLEARVVAVDGLQTVGQMEAHGEASLGAHGLAVFRGRLPRRHEGEETLGLGTEAIAILLTAFDKVQATVALDNKTYRCTTLLKVGFFITFFTVDKENNLKSLFFLF